MVGHFTSKRKARPIGNEKCVGHNCATRAITREHSSYGRVAQL